MKRKPRPPKPDAAPVSPPRSAGKAWAFLPGALAALLYLNTLGNQFAVDDGTVMENNVIVKKGIGALPEIFSTRYRAGFWERKENMYRPLSLAMFAVEWQFFPGNPLPGHLANVLLFSLTAILLYKLLCRMLPRGDPLIPLIAALLFAAHPIHTEVVANIKSRDEILALLFSVLALIALLAYHERRKGILLFWTVFFFMHALLSKESTIMVLFLAPLTLYFFTDFNKRPVRIAMAALAATAGAYLALRASVLGGLGSQAELQLINNSLLAAGDGLTRFASAMKIMGKYLWLLVVPSPLVFDYSYDQVKNVTIGQVQAWLPLLVMVAMLVYAVRTFRQKNIYSFCILFFGISIALVSNVVFLIESTMAERFLYLPSIGFCLALAAWLVHALGAKKVRPMKSLGGLLGQQARLVAAVGVVLVLYSFKTIDRNTCWKDNLTLLANDVKHAPESARIRYAYGSAILLEQALPEEDPASKERLLDQAIVHLEKGVSILSTYADAYYHLGLAYKEKGDFRRAIASFESARRSKTFNKAEFYVAAGISYGSAGRYREAIADLQRAITIDPESFDAYNNLGIYFTDSNNLAGAIDALKKAHALKPQNEKAVYNLGNVYAKSGDYESAIRYYGEAVALDSLYEDAYNNIGNCYAARGDYRNALVYYERVIRINPGNLKVLNNLGVTYKLLGDDVNGDKYLKLAGGG